MIKFAIFVIAYNASKTIVDVYQRIPDKIKTKASEIFIIDDCSQDNTYEIIDDFRKKNRLNNLTVFRNEKNMGYGGNQKKGYRYAIDKGYDVVVMLHGDLQYAPEKIGSLIKPFYLKNRSLGVVIGSRILGDPFKGGMPFYKYIPNRFLTTIQNFLLGSRLSEFHSGYRAYSCRILSKIPFESCSDQFVFDTEIIIMLSAAGYKIEEVAIPTHYGDEICRVPLIKYGIGCITETVKYKLTQTGLATFDKYILKNQSHRNNIYQIKESFYSSHSQINRYLKNNVQDHDSVKILDVGCGEGTVNIDMQRWNLYGIDSNIALINHNYHRIYLAGVDDYQKIQRLKFPKFDYIIFADILEHLIDPEKTLIFYSKYLKKDGLIIISVPNIANIYIRLMLIFGIFNYTDRGILDRTHLKFFTNKSLTQLCQNVGYIIKEKMTTPIPLEIIFPGLIKVKKQHFLTKLIYKITCLRPSLFGYQFIIVICKDKSR